MVWAVSLVSVLDAICRACSNAYSQPEDSASKSASTVIGWLFQHNSGTARTHTHSLTHTHTPSARAVDDAWVEEAGKDDPNNPWGPWDDEEEEIDDDLDVVSICGKRFDYDLLGTLSHTHITQETRSFSFPFHFSSCVYSFV